jgi:hypothetical protein
VSKLGLCSQVRVVSLGQTIAIEHFQEAQRRRKFHSPVFWAETPVRTYLSPASQISLRLGNCLGGQIHARRCVYNS